MILAILAIGTAASVWMMKGSKTKEPAEKDESKKSSLAITRRYRQLVHDISNAIGDEERLKLQVDVDPEQRQRLEQARQKNRLNLWLALGATGIAVLASFNPAFFWLGVLSVLFLSRETFTLVFKDFKRGHYFSLYLFSIVVILIMIGIGHMILAALISVMGNFFAGIINRIEDNSQRHLINVFSGHPKKVWLLRDGVEIQVDFHTLEAGDIVIVNAGETIPVDGRVQGGEGQADQHMLTGESRPVEKVIGDDVFASTLLLSGHLEIEVNKAGNATMAAQIGDVLNQTAHYKDTVMTRGRIISDRFLPFNLALAGLTLPFMGINSALAVSWANLGGTMGAAGSLSVLSYLQLLSRKAILIKDGRVLESLRQVNTVVFDKTGTLTLEQPTVCAVHAFNEFDEHTVLRYAAAAEYRQPHPIARAIITKAEAEQVMLPNLDGADYEVGYGIRVRAEDRVIRVGSSRFVQREGLELPPAAEALMAQAENTGHSMVYVGIDGQMAGILELEPTVRPEAAEIIQFLKQRGIHCCIISGDHPAPTRAMAERLGIEEYFAEVLPEHKADYVNRLRQEDRFVCFIGDGINDAVALKSAHVSISLKGASTAATDTAQVILMDGTLNHLPALFGISDEFEETMQRNLVISFSPGVFIIGGVYFLHFGIAISMAIFYLGCFLSIGNVLWPLVKHQQSDPPPIIPAPAPIATLLTSDGDTQHDIVENQEPSV
jgi:Cu2+-exporting ATPase